VREPEDVASENGCFVSESGRARVEKTFFFEGMGVPFSILYSVLH
jgi:hypothetical protein